MQVRLNGGTNIAAAVAKAGSLLKAEEATNSRDMRRVLVLLTGERPEGKQQQFGLQGLIGLTSFSCMFMH